MKKDRLFSDQLYRWSDIYEESICCIITQKKKGSGPPASACGGRPPRISDRTLQEMWKIRLPVCQRTRTRAQILSFNKSNGKKSSDGLCPSELSRASRNLPGELSINQKNPERNLRYQFRTSPSQGAIVGNKHALRHCYRHRYRGGRHVGCQYDQRKIEVRLPGNFKHGGKL